MNSQLSAMQFFNQETSGNATSAKEAQINYINKILSSNFGSLEAAQTAYYEYLKTNPPVDLQPTQVVVSDGDTLAEAGGGTIAVEVTAGVATYTYTAP